MRVSATNKQPKESELLPPETAAHIQAQAENRIAEVKEQIKQAQEQAATAKAERRKASKAVFAGKVKGAAIGPEDMEHQKAVQVQEAIVQRAELQARLLRAKLRELERLAANARRGVMPALEQIVDSRRRQIIVGRVLAPDASDPAKSEYARVLRAREAFAHQEHERQLREAGLVRG